MTMVMMMKMVMMTTMVKENSEEGQWSSAAVSRNESRALRYRFQCLNQFQSAAQPWPAVDRHTTCARGGYADTGGSGRGYYSMPARGSGFEFP